MKGITRLNGGGGADCTPYINELAISQGLLAYSNLILSADHANDLDNGKSFGFDNDNAVQYKALHGTYSESVIVNPSASATTLILNTTVGLVAGQEYTLQDGSNKENVIITSIDSGTVVTVPAITNSYTSAYLYDYYVGNPVGVVDYDFRADVLANGSLVPVWDVEYLASSGDLPNLATPSWVLTVGDGSVSIGSGILNVTTTGTQTHSYNRESGGITAVDIKRVSALVQVNSNGSNAGRESQVLRVGDGTRSGILVMQTDGLYSSDFTTSTLVHSVDLSSVFNIVTIEVSSTFGMKVYLNGLLVGTVLYANLASSGTAGIFFGDLGAVSGDYSSDVDYKYVKYQLDLANNPDTLGAPFTPMDLITQSYTLTNASGAILQHFAKFGTGAYNLMTETSTDNFSYENSTEEDNIKIKTTVVGDTSQLLDIQLELGGVSNV